VASGTDVPGGGQQLHTEPNSVDASHTEGLTAPIPTPPEPATGVAASASLIAGRRRVVAGALALTLLALLASRASGMVRDAVIAYQFGASATTDSFLSAFTLPDLISSLLLTGLVGVAVIPVLIRSQTSEGATVWRTANAVLNLLIVASAVLALVGAVAAGPLVNALTPGLSGTHAAMAAEMARIMFPALVFFAAASLLTGILNIGSRFVIPTLAGLFVNVAMIGAAVVFGRELGVSALAWGFLVGSVLQLTVLIPGASRLGYRYQLTFGLSDPNVRAVFRAMAPLLLVVAMQYGRLIVERWIGSILVPGTIALLNFSNRLYLFPPALIVAPISTVLYPMVARGHVAGDEERIRQTISTGIRLIVLSAVPAMLLLRYFAHPMVAVIYQRGAFDASSSAATGYLLGLFALGLVPVCINEFLTRTYFARQRARFALLITGSSLAVTVAADVVLTRLIGYPGLAWGATAGAWWLLAIVVIDGRIWRQREIVLTALRAVVAGLVMTALAVGVFDILPISHTVLRLGVALLMGGGVYLLVLRLLSAQDARLLTGLAGDFLSRSRA